MTLPLRTEPIPTGQPGLDGSMDVGLATLGELSANVTPSHADILLRAAARDYINLQLADAYNQLLYLKGLLSTKLRDTTPQAPTGKDLVRYQAAKDKADGLIRQLELQLDFFAQPMNYVPRLSVEDYYAQTTSLLKFGATITGDYLKYKSLEEAKKHANESFSAARSNALNAITSMQADSQTLINKQTETLAAIARLETTLSSAWVQLMNAQQAFKVAVASRGQGCKFEQVLAVGAAIAGVFVSAGTFGAALPGLAGALAGASLKYDDGKPVADDFAGFKYKVGKIATVGQDAASIVEAYNKLKGSFPTPPAGQAVPDLPGDEVKIVASADQIEAAIQPFLDLPEAKQYDSLIKLFLSVSQARNNKILEYNAAATQLTTLSANINQAQAAADAAQDSMASVANPFLGDAVSYMTDAWMDSMSAIVRVIYQMRSAYKYYALEDPPLNIQDFSIGSLTASAEDLRSRYKQAMETFGSDPQSIKALPINLMPYITPENLRQFRQTGTVTVTVDSAHHDLSRLSNVYVTRVSLRMEDRTGILKSFSANITHEGRALVFSSSGKAFLFSHAPVTVAYKVTGGTDVVLGNIATEKSAYAGLTPYGPWTINLDLQSIPSAFFNSMTKLSLVFDGKGRARN